MTCWIREPVIDVVESYDDIISARKRAMQLLLRKDMSHRRNVPIYMTRYGKATYGAVYIKGDHYLWQSHKRKMSAYILSTTGKLRKRLY